MIENDSTFIFKMIYYLVFAKKSQPLKSQFGAAGTSCTMIKQGEKMSKTAPTALLLNLDTVGKRTLQST